MKPEPRLRAGAVLLAVLFALILAAWVSRLFFTLPAGQIYENQDDASNVYMLIDFREALETGHWSPQWSTYMHGGLGDALFSYYQPGFFYLASMLPHSLDPYCAIGISVLLAFAVGSFGMWRLVGLRFGPECGFAAMALFALSTYAGTEIYVRGDCAELLAMMLLPWQVQAYLMWRGSHGSVRLAAASVASAAVILSHAPIAVAIYLCLGLHILVADILQKRSFRSAMLAGIPLLCGGLLASFYWFPVVFEWQLVQPAAAFGGFYLYSRHFVGIRSLLGRFADSPGVVPVALGPVLVICAVAASVVLLVRRKQWTKDQRDLIGVLGCVSVLAGFLMLRFSSPIWRLSAGLQRLQFPWRFLALLTMGLAGIAGIACLFVPRRQRIAAVMIVILALAFYPHGLPSHIVSLALPLHPADLVHLNYVPDGANEWLPNGAHPVPPAPMPAISTSMPGCTVSGFERSQSRLTAKVDAAAGCLARLPHYFFPVGWTATLEGVTVPIENDDGWMAVRFPNGGHGDLVLKFSGTPARRYGLLISLLTAVALAIWSRLRSVKTTGLRR